MTVRKEHVLEKTNLTYTIPVSNGTSSSIYVGGGGGSGGTGLHNTTYTLNTNSTFRNGNGSTVMSIPHGENKVIIDEKAALEVQGRMIINGIDLEERLSTIEKLLDIPTRDAIMEEKYEKLRSLSNQYKQALEEYKTWQRLKDSK